MKLLAFGVLIGLTSAPIPTPAAAETTAELYQQGIHAFERAQFQKAIRIWRPIADNGHREAQFNLGAMYDNGKGTKKNPTEASKWYRWAADQGHVIAQYSLGNLYLAGRRVHQDTEQAIKWYRKAGEQGHTDAQFNLGEIYKDGTRVKRDYIKAFQWLSLAALRKHNAGVIHKNFVEAFMSPEDVKIAQKLAVDVLKKYKKK